MPSEIGKYFGMSTDDQYKVPNPVILWHRHQEKFPYLVKLARHLYWIPATSACVERQFSAGGLLIIERRSSISSDTVENM